ncbi:hypothetical protein Tco_1355574 [Tanacetum coccineum]
MHVNEVPECMRISGFMHGFTNLDLIKRLNDNIPKTVDVMMSVTTTFFQGEVAVANQSRKKALPTWKHYETSHMPSSDKKLDFKNRHKSSRRHDSDGQENPIVIEAEVEGNLIHRMYMDGGFSGEISWPLGQISLMVSLGDGEHSTKALMNFMVVRSLSPYNGIIGRSGLRKIQAVPSAAHEMLKFLVEEGIVRLCSNTIIPAECIMVAEASNKPPPDEPVEAEGIKVAIHPEYPEQKFHNRWKPIRKEKDGTLRFAQE